MFKPDRDPFLDGHAAGTDAMRKRPNRRHNPHPEGSPEHLEWEHGWREGYADECDRMRA